MPPDLPIAVADRLPQGPDELLPVAVGTSDGPAENSPIESNVRQDELLKRTADTKLVGCVEDHLQLNRLEIARGRWLTPRDDGEKVVVPADETARRLFPFEDSIEALRHE